MLFSSGSHETRVRRRYGCGRSSAGVYHRNYIRSPICPFSLAFSLLLEPYILERSSLCLLPLLEDTPEGWHMFPTLRCSRIYGLESNWTAEPHWELHKSDTCLFSLLQKYRDVHLMASFSSLFFSLILKTGHRQRMFFAPACFFRKATVQAGYRLGRRLPTRPKL